MGCTENTTVGCIASGGCIQRTTVGCIASGGCNSAQPGVALHPAVAFRGQPRVVLHPGVAVRGQPGVVLHPAVAFRGQPGVVLHPAVAVLSSVRGIRNASLPDSCFLGIASRFGVTGLPWAAAQTRLGTSPQTPSPLRGGLKPQNKKDPPQLSRSDSVVKGQGNSVPLRGSGWNPDVTPT